MTTRLTQQYVDVAGTFTDGELRVYRQVVSVLTQGEVPTGNTFNESVSDTLNITDSESHLHYLNYSPSDTLNLSDVGFSEPFPARVTETLNLTDTVTLIRDFGGTFADTLNFTQVAQKCTLVSANNTLNFNDVDYSYEFLVIMDRKIAYDTLNFQQTVQTLSSILTTDTLNLQQTVNVYNSSRPVSASNHIFFQEARLPQFHHMWVEHTLGLTDWTRVPITYTFTQTLGITDSGSITNLSDGLVFVQVVKHGFGASAINTLNLTQNMSAEALFSRALDDDLGIGHSLTWYDNSACSKKQYTPFQGEDTTGGPQRPSDTLPHVQVSPMTDRMLLYYPALGTPTYSVTLRAPEMDNRDRNAYTRITRETMGGKLIVYADPTWPKVRTMVVTIIGLTTVQAAAYQTFARNTLGLEIGITDWEGRQWAGVIVNPEEPITQDGKESWTLTFSMEGELVDAQDNRGTLGITDAVTYTIV